MPTAKKTKSGSWHCIVYSGRDENGKRTYKSFTVRDPTRAGKRRCEQLAADYAAGHREKPPEKFTVRDVVRRYIDVRGPALSPATVRGYELYVRRMGPILDTRTVDLTQADLQKWINDLGKEKYSEKYIKNINGFLQAALAYSGWPTYNIVIPASARPQLHTPCDNEIRLLLDHIRNRPELYTAVLLAAFGSMRRGEICALTVEDFDGCSVRVHRSMVRDIDGFWHTRESPKTVESNRIVILPPEVREEITLPVQGRVIPLHPEQISNRFRRAVRSCGCEAVFRFHDLRHYYVSIAHALGIPDAYIMQMGGWRTDSVMHRIYRDTLPDVMQAEQEKLNSHSRGVIPH